VIGHERCPIVDTWWQPDPGRIMIGPLPGLVAAKPGPRAANLGDVTTLRDPSVMQALSAKIAAAEDDWGSHRPAERRHDRRRASAGSSGPRASFSALSTSSVGSGITCRASRGSPARSPAPWRISTARCAQPAARAEGRRILALRVLAATIALNSTVDVGS
jgi:hypothetical protein